MAYKKLSDIRLNKVTARRTLIEATEAAGYISLAIPATAVNSTGNVYLGSMVQDVEFIGGDVFMSGDPGGTKPIVTIKKGANTAANVDLSTSYTAISAVLTATGSAALFMDITALTNGAEDITQNATLDHVPIVMNIGTAASNAVNYSGNLWFKQVDDVDKS